MGESYREILPYLRPRSTELSEMGWLGVLSVGILVAVAVGAVASFVWTRWRARSLARRSFVHAALEHRLSKAQVRLLLDLASRHHMHDPLLLLTSLKAFDRHAGRLAGAVGSDGDDPRLEMLSAIRRRLGFDAPPTEQRFYTTRTLAPGQVLMVWPHGSDTGFLHCVVVDRDERAVTAVPLLRDGDRRLSELAAGDAIKVRFWRKGDTEYRFRAQILEVQARTTSIRIRHAEQLERVQLRDYYRVAASFQLILYVLPQGVEEVSPERVSAVAADRLSATAIDISGGGLSVHVGAAVPRSSELVVDPDFAGEFPLAGIHCLVVEQAAREGGWYVRLQFVALPGEVRDDLVAAVFAHEMRVAVP